MKPSKNDYNGYQYLYNPKISYSNKKRRCKFVFMLVFLIGFLVYLMEFSTIGSYIQHIELYSGESRYFDIHIQKLGIENGSAENEKSYFVNTVGCKMPSFPVTSTFISSYIEKMAPIECRKSLIESDERSFWIMNNSTKIKLLYNITDINKLKCSYESYKRNTENKNKFNGVVKSMKFGETISSKNKEFIKITCYYENETQIFQDFLYFVPIKDKLNITDNNTNSNNKLNVLVLGLDSVSRLNFRRQLKKTHRLLIDKLKSIELYGYNKVGDNTYPNLVPALTGFDTKELADSCLDDEKKSTFDNCHFIWKTYSDNGYHTTFAEDIAYLGLFNYFRGGFKKQPTDYYTRPLFREMEKNIATQKKMNVYMCLGSKRPFDVLIDYINKFLASFKNLPFFSFFWSSSMSHDFFNMPALIDGDLSNFLLKLEANNTLNNTVLFLMSDHGIRWGSFRNTYQGMMEERQPFLFIVLPKSFREKYPLATAHMKVNRKRLTTHYDLYETFRDLVNTTILSDETIKFRTKELTNMELIPRGISLFLPIPPTRTCESSGIEAHWCTCHEKEVLSTIDPNVQKSARFLVKEINAMLSKYPQCQTLYLMSIKEATLGKTNFNITKDLNKKHFSDITVHLVTKPGQGEFEGTVRLHPHGNNTLTGTISRTNLYGKQSYCIDDYAMKLYCFCGR